MTPAEVLFEVIEILDRLGIPYYLGGSYASGVHGVPRSTHDADLVVDMDGSKVGALCEALGTGYYSSSEMMIDSIRHGRAFNIIHHGTQFKVDFFPVGSSRLRRCELGRRVRTLLGDRQVYVSTAEETLLAKLNWYRIGGEISDRQWKDIVGIVEVQGDRLDWAYLERWAPELGVADLLKRLRAP